MSTLFPGVTHEHGTMAGIIGGGRNMANRKHLIQKHYDQFDKLAVVITHIHVLWKYITYALTYRQVS